MGQIELEKYYFQAQFFQSYQEKEVVFIIGKERYEAFMRGGN